MSVMVDNMGAGVPDTEISHQQSWGEKPMSQGAYLFAWAIASILSFAVFVKYF